MINIFGVLVQGSIGCHFLVRTRGQILLCSPKEVSKKRCPMSVLSGTRLAHAMRSNSFASSTRQTVDRFSMVFAFACSRIAPLKGEQPKY